MPPRHARALASERSARASAKEQATSGAASPGLDRLYRDQAPRLTRYFRRRLHETDEAPDLVQEAFARLAAFMVRETPMNPAPYLQRIACNLLFERTRRRNRNLVMFHLPLGEGREPAVPAEQELHIEERDVMRIYRKALDELPDKTRRIFLLHRVDDLAYREIAQRLGISIPTVQYHIARSLAHINAALERE